MIRKVFSLMVVTLVAGVLLAQESKTVKITGNLIDNACAESAKDIDARVKNHSTKCAMMESCATSGYAVYADHKLYKLDEKGNTGAAELLKNTKTEKGLRVDVEGTVEGDTIHVTKITEAVEAVN